MKGKLAGHPQLTRVETILDEWNMSLSNPNLDPWFHPAFILETTFGFQEQGLSRSAYYHIRDYFVDPATFALFMSPKGTNFMAHWWNEMPQYDGLYDNQDRVRPAYYAFKLLSLIKGDYLPVAGAGTSVSAIAARGGQWVNLLVWNFPLESEAAVRKVTVQFPYEQNGEFRLVRLNPVSSTNTWEQVHSGSASHLEHQPLQFTLRPYEIYWIELTESH